MQAQTKTEREWRGATLCIAAVAAAAVGLTIGMLGTRHTEPRPGAVTQARTRGSTAAPSLPASSPITSPPRVGNDSGLADTEQQALIVGTALLGVFNAFLLEKADDDRAAQLKAYLKSRLPAPAYAEAVQTAERYLAYMQAHDDLLAAQHLNPAVEASAVDIDRVAIWRQQRDRLRQRLLGDRVVQAWYQNDDAQLDQVLQEWRQRAEDERGSPASSQAARYPVPHWRNPSDEERHRQYMLGVLRRAVTSYAAEHARLVRLPREH